MSDQRVAVYGLGRVGMPLAAAWLRAGFSVTGYDINRELIQKLCSSSFEWIEEPGVATIFEEAVTQGRLSFTADGEQASRACTIHLIAVPTPMEWSSKRFDSGPLFSAIRTVASGLKAGDVVIVESSVPPGTTCGPVRKNLEELSGLVAEKDFYLGFSPERIYVGRALEDLVKRYPKIVGGVGPKSTQTIAKLYSRVAERGVIAVSDSTTAEMVKLFEGIYRDVNIALANELALYCERAGVDYYEVREAANSQPYSHLHLPGPGVGGMCIPVYPYFVLQHAQASGQELRLVRLSRQINESMPQKVVETLLQKAKAHGMDPQTIKVTILGAAFRGNVSDTRNSPTHAIVGALMAGGVKQVAVHDPLVKSDEELRRLGVPLFADLAQALSGSSAIVVATDHPQYVGLGLGSLCAHTQRRPLIVLDTKGILKPEKLEGVVYSCLGKPEKPSQC